MSECTACAGPTGAGTLSFCAECCKGMPPHIYCGYCEDCGRQYGPEAGFTDLVIPDAAWAVISPYGDERGLLCPCCMLRRAERAGLTNVPAYFMSGPFCIAALDGERQRILREWTP